MSELIFYAGTMESGKSTLALQTDYNHTSKGLVGLRFTRFDRTGEPRISSRLGISADAHFVSEDTDLYGEIASRLGAGERIDYIICDEAQFYTPDQIDQLARIADGLHVKVFAFAILTDFRRKLFPATSRLVELADEVISSPVPALCWCGSRGTHQARLVDGAMVMEGETVIIGDTDTSAPVSYVVLCRRHHMLGQTGIDHQ